MANNALTWLALSVLMHVAWNVMTRLTDKRANFLWWGLLAHLIIFAPWSLWQLITHAQWSDKLFTALIISASANVFYFFSLRRAYHFASVSFVYPIARGSPILIAFWAWLIFDEQLNLFGLSGILISILGLWLLAKFDSGEHTSAALRWAVMAALGTSIYSLSDKFAVNYLPTFGTQLGYISVGYLASFVFLSLEQYKQTNRLTPEQRPKGIFILLGGLFIGVAYALVVRAMFHLSASAAIVISNSGIVLATILSIFLFKEKDSAFHRLASSIIISIGIAMVVLDL